MENEVNLESAEQHREAIGILAAASENQRAEIEALGNVLKLMDARIQLQQRLIDAMHEIFVAHGWAKARPVEKTSQVN
jgi:hypothetical protein